MSDCYGDSIQMQNAEHNNCGEKKEEDDEERTW